VRNSLTSSSDAGRKTLASPPALYFHHRLAPARQRLARYATEIAEFPVIVAGGDTRIDFGLRHRSRPLYLVAWWLSRRGDERQGTVNRGVPPALRGAPAAHAPPGQGQEQR